MGEAIGRVCGETVRGRVCGETGAGAETLAGTDGAGSLSQVLGVQSVPF